MKAKLWPILLITLAACASPKPPSIAAETQPAPTRPSPSPLPFSPTKASTPSSTPDYVSTMQALGPVLEVSFDGVQCTMIGPTELSPGEHAMKYTSTTGHFSAPEVGWMYPGKTYQDMLDFMGPPGSYLEDAPSWCAMIAPIRSIRLDAATELRHFTFDKESEYAVVAGDGTEHFWPCGHFTVKTSP